MSIGRRVGCQSWQKWQKRQKGHENAEEAQEKFRGIPAKPWNTLTLTVDRPKTDVSAGSTVRNRKPRGLHCSDARRLDLLVSQWSARSGRAGYHVSTSSGELEVNHMRAIT